MRIALAAALIVVLATDARAHVIVVPDESEAGGWERYTVLVPTEKQSPTVRVAVRLPAGMEVIAVETKPGWEGRYEPFPLGSSRVEWNGGRIPVGGFVSFEFLAWNPPAAKPIRWEATQFYEDGTNERWADDHGSTTTLKPATGKQQMHRHAPHAAPKAKP